MRMLRPASPRLPACLSNLAACLVQRHTAGGSPGDRRRATATFRHAARSSLAVAPGLTLAAADQWRQWAAARRAWPEAAEAGGYGLDAMRGLFQAQLLRPAKETWLGSAQGLPAETAVVRARAGDARDAALALEGGRALLLSEALERDRAQVEDLRALGRHDLAVRYQRTAERWADLTHLVDAAAAP